AWLVSAVKPSTIQEEERLVQSLLPFLACAGSVDVEESLCLVVAKFLAWIFLYDGINDDVQEGLGGVHGATDMFLKELHKVLLTREATMATLSNVADCLQAATAIDVWLAWWSELCTHLSPAYRPASLKASSATPPHPPHRSPGVRLPTSPTSTLTSAIAVSASASTPSSTSLRAASACTLT
ncbi:hypothetical protein GOP47_0010883, partial [Adiantum capillus-veneris]